MRLAGTLHNPLSVKHFHAVWAGNVPECSLKSCIGKASPLCYVLRDMPPVRRLAELRKAPVVNLHEPMPMAPITQDGPIWMACPDQKTYRPPHM